MTILSSLNQAYERLAINHQVPAFGYSNEKISFVMSLNPDGSMASAPRDLCDQSGKKPVPRFMYVPQPDKRTSGIKPNFLWDKTSYVLGVTAKEDKRSKAEHQAFTDFHMEALKNSGDEGLQALCAFLRQWTPERFQQADWPDDLKSAMLDQNIVFTLENDRLSEIYLHDRPAARQVWAKLSSEGDKTKAVCLVSGEKSPIARLHPSIKGVWGGQSSGGSIVSFNLDAFTSYGHEQGDNAPISEAAAFAYTTALNKYLEKGSHNRIQIGDASTVFWADASNAKVAEEAEDVAASLFEVDTAVVARDEIKPILENIRQGKPLAETAPELSEGVRFFVLGLAPNAARISIRYWFEDDFGTLVENYQKFLADMRIEPSGRNDVSSLWHYLLELAVLGKSENVPPHIAGEWMRSILTGTAYPMALLTNVLMRIRADKEINTRRIAMLKAVLVRNFKSKEAPVALDPDNRNKGYLLGRLFALYERIQSGALGDNLNSTVKDKFYGAASAQPRKVFALLDQGSAKHLSKLKKQNPGYKISLEKQVAEIFALMSPSEDPYPTALSAGEQALFALGYYHQRSEFFKPKQSTETVKE